MSNPSLPDVSVIIANRNGANVLPRCLVALAAQTYPAFEVIVVDDASTDHSADALEVPGLDVRVVHLERNCGFAVANNIGARVAQSKWLALLNNDAFPDPDWLANLLSAAASNPAFKFFASRMTQADAPARLDGTGDVYHISGMAWRRHHGVLGEGVAQRAEEVFSPCGGAAMYDREAFLLVGGFDEDFFNYHEDVDLGFRLRLKGFRCLYVPDAVVAHLGSATFGKRSDFSVYHGHRNLVWAFFKNMPTRLLWQYLPIHLAANLFYWSYYVSRGQARAITRAKIDAVRGLPKFLRKRRDIQRDSRVSAADIAGVLDHDWYAPLREFLARQ